VREKHERMLIRRLSRALGNQFRAVVDIVTLVGRVEFTEDFWREQKLEMVKELRPLFLRVFLEHAGTVIPKKAAIGVDFVNVEALEWAMKYTPELVDELIKVNWETIRKYMMQFVTDKTYVLKDFINDLEPLFGYSRAKLIAVTEITRAYSQATEAIKHQYESMGAPMVEVWETAVDDKVCDICGPRDSKDRGEGWSDPPPAHPNCRCVIVLRMA